MKNYQKKQLGFTLIELMIAMTLGVFLTTGILEIFSANQRTIRLQTALSRVQENGRFAIDFLVKDIRMAGYWGCLAVDAEVENKLNADATYDLFTGGSFPTHISGVDNNAGNAPIIDGTDSFQVYGLKHSGVMAKVIDQPSNHAASLKVEPSSGLVQHDIVIVTQDCVSGDLFQLTNVTGGGGFDNLIHNTGGGASPGNNIKDLEIGLYPAAAPGINKYDTGAIVMKVAPNFISYSIRSGENGQPSLFKDDIELIEGVENMQILYGINNATSPVPTYYTTADKVTDWTQVGTLKVSLLVASNNDNVTSKKIDYTYNNAATTPTDKRLRRIFSTVITVRNAIN